MRNQAFICKSALSLMAAAVMALSAATAKAEEVFSDAQKEALNGLIAEYIKSNPQAIMDSVQAFQMQQQIKAEEDAVKKLQDHLPTITASDMPAAGSENPDLTVVEFFDYNCGYCKRALPDIQKVLENDPKIRFVFVEMPILGPSSSTAAQWALAAHKQGKYFEYHAALMNHRGAKEEPELSQIAKDLGLDLEKMKSDAAGQEIADMIAKNMEIVNDIGIRGTPAFIIGDTIVRGYLGEDGLEKAINDERANNG